VWFPPMLPPVLEALIYLTEESITGPTVNFVAAVKALQHHLIDGLALLRMQIRQRGLFRNLAFTSECPIIRPEHHPPLPRTPARLNRSMQHPSNLLIR
jgi:hypothetical protein